jgi:hypothetical protein
VGIDVGVVVVGAAGICGLSCGGLFGSLGTGVDVELEAIGLLAGGGGCGVFWIGCEGLTMFVGVDVEVEIDLDVEVVDVGLDVLLFGGAIFVTCLFTFVHIRP